MPCASCLHLILLVFAATLCAAPARRHPFDHLHAVKPRLGNPVGLFLPFDDNSYVPVVIHLPADFKKNSPPRCA